MAMNEVRQGGVMFVLMGVLTALGGIALIYLPLAVILAGIILVATGTVILRGSRP